MAVQAVKVSVEKLLEQQVEEISRTGEEKYVRPLTISEELTELAQKIDFKESGETATAQEDESDSEDEPSGQGQKGKSQDMKDKAWPWESLQTKLRTTLQEVCVLLDVLQTVKQRKYIVLDPVTQKEEPQKPTVQMLGKRKSLKRAADIIHQGAKRMEGKFCNDYAVQGGLDIKDYFHELMKLRQRWRVKKSGNFIIGDLSYRTAGSKFWHQGLFEVTKTEWEEEKEAVASTKEALSVKAGTDLDGSTRTVFQVRSDVAQLSSASKAIATASSLCEPMSWQRQLKQAQHNLYSKELFSQLAREAYSSSSHTSTELSRDEVEVKLPFGFSLAIINKKSGETTPDDDLNEDHGMGQFLQYRAEMLLRNQHKRTALESRVQPPTQTKSSTVHAEGLPGFFMPGRQSLNQQMLFETLVSEARHSVLRHLTAEVIDKVSAKFSDPTISCHWGMISSPTHSSATVSLLSRKCGFSHRTSLLIDLYPSGYHIITSSGLAVDVSGQTERLEDFILAMISEHQLEVAQQRLEHFGWIIRQVNKTPLLHLSLDVEPNEMVPGLLAESPTDTRISVLAEHGNRIQVILERPQVREDEHETLLTLLGKDWIKNVHQKEDVDFNRLYGKNFVDKFDSLLALVGYFR